MAPNPRRWNEEVPPLFSPLPGAFTLAVPFALVSGAGAAAWAVGSTGMMASLGWGLGLSSSTPLLASVAGATSVATCSIASGAAGCSVVAAAHANSRGRAVSDRVKREVADYLHNAEQALADIVIGMTSFVMLGGRFRSMLASDVRYPGALAVESLRASGPSYATEVQKFELDILFKRYGCHHCGTKKGQVIGDHMPPSAVMNREKLPRGIYRSLWKMRYGIKAGRQRFFPQCASCSQIQSAAVRNGVKRLVLHRGARAFPLILVGSLVALRHYSGGESRANIHLQKWATGEFKAIKRWFEERIP